LPEQLRLKALAAALLLDREHAPRRRYLRKIFGNDFDCCIQQFILGEMRFIIA
jgi:hypothetical protein